MLVRTITYADNEGNERTDSFHFDLSTDELIELEKTLQGGLGDRLQRIVRTGEGANILIRLRDLVLISLVDMGDGEPKKTPIHVDSFVHSDAFEKLLTDLVSDLSEASTFVSNVVPKGTAVKIQSSDSVMAMPNVVDKAFADYTHDELLNMPQAQFDTLVAADNPRHRMSRDNLVVALKRKTN